MNNSCIVGAFTKIEKSHKQIARPGTTSCTSYKNLFREWIETATRIVTVDRSTTSPDASSVVGLIL